VGIHHAQNAASPGGVLLTVGEIKEKKEKGKEGEGEKRESVAPPIARRRRDGRARPHAIF
jgi:hypothetical protein